MRAWLAVALLCAAGFAVADMTVPDCEDLPFIQLPGPPDGLGMRLPQRNACQQEDPLNYSLRLANAGQPTSPYDGGCFDVRCTLSLNAFRFLGGAPVPGYCVACLTVTGTTCTSLGFRNCEVGE